MSIFDTFLNVPRLRRDAAADPERADDDADARRHLHRARVSSPGVVLAMVRLYAAAARRAGWRSPTSTCSASIPVLVLLFIVYYALPFAGIRLTLLRRGDAPRSRWCRRLSAEIVRAGIEAIPKGQFEAARALGLHFSLMMRKVVLPQAIRIVIPPLTSNAINVMKDTALASVVAMPDLLKQANQAQALAANPTPLIVAAVIYLIILLPLVRARRPPRNGASGASQRAERASQGT